MGIISIIVALLVFTLLIVVHEFGHFLAARKCGVPVEEFSIGMGPALYKHQGKNTLFSIRLFPIGGYCKMTGEEEASDVPDAFCNKGVWQRILIVVAGALFNIIFAIIVLMILPNFSLVVSQNVAEVLENSPAYEAGIEKGDKIIGSNGKKHSLCDDTIFDITVSKNDTDTIDLLVEKDNEVKIVSVNYVPSLLITDKADEADILKVGTYITTINGKSIKDISNIKKEISSKNDKTKEDEEDVEAEEFEELENVEEEIVEEVSEETSETDEEKEETVKVIVTLLNDENEYELNEADIEILKNNSANRSNYIGLGFEYEKLNPLQCMGYGLKRTRYYITSTYKSFALMFSKKVSKDQIAGPVGIIKMFGDSYEEGIVRGFGVALYNVFALAAMISINLGVINLLPLPALDGGRFVILLVEVVRRKPMDLEKESWIHFVGFVLLMILMVLIIFNDVTNIVA